MEDDYRLLSSFAVSLFFVVEPQRVPHLHHVASIGESDRVATVYNNFV